MLLLKIIYKAYYKTKNRKASTVGSFAGMNTYYIVTLVFAILLTIPVKLNSQVPADTLKIVLSIPFIGLGFLSYKLNSTYAHKKINGESFYDEINLSVRLCRFLLVVYHFVLPLLIVYLLFFVAMR